MDRMSTAGTLLDTAVELLEAEGLESLTVRRISQAAGMSTIGIYSHFSSKEGLIGAVWVFGYRQLAETLSGVGDPGLDGALALSYRYLAWADAHPHLYRLMFGGLAPGVELDDADRAVSRSAFDLLVEVCAPFPPDGERAALAVWRYLHGVASLAIAGVAPPGIAAEVDHAEVIGRILAPGPAPDERH